MHRLAGWLPQRILYLASGLYFGATFLRTLLIYGSSPALPTISGFLALWLVLFSSEAALTSRWPRYFPFYLACQSLLAFYLLSLPGFPDYFGNLLSLLSMQVMLRLDLRVGAAWIGLCALVMVFILMEANGISEAVALSLVYTAGNVFLGAFTRTMRLALAARQENQALAGQLQQADLELKAYSTQVEQLAIARERNHLARELHDSVTQTVFSMNLATQSALLVLERDPRSVSAYLDRLYQLARSALAEMQLLVSELKPVGTVREGLVARLRSHLVSSYIPEGLSVTLEVEGEGPLSPDEEQGLFRIAEEALNNIVKHAKASQAQIKLHLAEPFWMEIEDLGRGFDLHQAQRGAGFGLTSMNERAAEIGWALQIITSPGAGACIRVEKAPVPEGLR